MPLAIDKLTRDKIFSHGLLKNSDLDAYLKWTRATSIHGDTQLEFLQTDKRR